MSPQALRLLQEAADVALETGVERTKVLLLASHIPAGNGHEEQSFDDPRRPGIGKGWIETTLRELPAVRRRLLRQPRL